MPAAVHRIDHLPLTMDDGVVLSAAVFLPVRPGRYGAILDAVPYRKDDDFLAGDWDVYAAIAARGFACVRLDLRGSGSSRGILENEYTRRELDDLVQTIALIAEQPWCNGRVGMTGVSWGGFNAIQVAMLRPPALKAIAPIHFSTDRYRSDVHYVGGVVQLAESVAWAGGMVAEMGLPPHPVHTGPDWVEVWRDRLERTPQWPIAKFTHQRRDAYWRHASACEDWASIEVPVLAIGGWIDSYQDACLAVLEHVTAPRRAVIGPWAHTRPHVGWPGPTLEHRDLLARWFDRWLHDVPNGVEHEPALVAYLREGCPRTPYPARVDGTWRAFAWPSSTRPTTTLHLADGGLAVAPTPLTPRTWAGPAWVGHAAPWWSAGHAPAGHGADMRRDDDASLVFDTPVLTEPLAILGHPLLTLEVSADRPVAMVAVRLEDVHPDGYSSMVCRGGLNLTRRDSDEAPTAVHPGARYTVEVPVVSTGTVIPAGHRLRLAIAGGHFPITWPAPEPFALTIHGGTLRLPAPDPACERPAPLLPERDTALDVAGPVVHEDGPAATWRIEREHVTGRTTHRNTGGWDAALPEGGRSFGSELVECTVLDDDPTSCRALSRWVAEVRQPGVHAVSRSRLEVWCTTTTFELEIDLAVERDGAPFFARGWRESFPRDLM